MEQTAKIKTPTELVEENFKGLSDFIKDEDILHWFKNLITVCIEDYHAQFIPDGENIKTAEQILKEHTLHKDKLRTLPFVLYNAVIACMEEYKNQSLPVSKVNQEKYQVGYPDYDVVGKFFKEIYIDNMEGLPTIEYRQCKQSNDLVHYLIYDNKLIAAVIQRRDEFNDLEYTFINLRSIPLSVSKVEDKKEDEAIRPPLGLMPEWRYKELRIEEIDNATWRYEEANYVLPNEWIIEKRELQNWLEKHLPTSPYAKDNTEKPPTREKHDEEIEQLKGKIKAQTEFIAGQVMYHESLLETNRKIKENTIDKAIEWCENNDAFGDEEEEYNKGYSYALKSVKQYLITLK